ncbi:MAG TPA: DNA polymerase [Tissierellaceae bacterium]|nr:DNA polymerase [Tissierellaceae bacterium]
MYIRCDTQLKSTRCIQYAYKWNEFPFDILKKDIVKSGKHKMYQRHPMTFDIETSKIPTDDEGHYQAFMYIWQVCIEGNVVFGRRWEELQQFMEKVVNSYRLSEGERVVVYVHNLSFEFQFIQDYFNFTDVFAMASRSILTAKTAHLEFRCSYKLSNMSLAKFIENTPNTLHYKGIDDLDYATVRTPDTPLTEVEYGYCFNDVKGLYECVMELLKEDNIATIPLTSTGYVRRDCRNAMNKNKNNRKMFLRSRLTLLQYKLLRECFRGGNTASDRYLTNIILKIVGSYDLSSSYPFQMIAREYPLGKWNYGVIPDIKTLEEYNSKYCTIARYSFKNIRLRDEKPIPYIPQSKCLALGDDREIYNGRILHADFLTISMTNIDYDIVKEQYEYDEIAVEEFHYSRKGLLPKELRDTIMYYFEKKSELKGDEEHYYEYMKSKNKLNSIYGMTVTNILNTEIEYHDGEYTEKKMTEEEMEEALDRYYKNHRSFLNYSWGVFVTAYARRELEDGLNIAGLDAIYCDTDSVKFIGNHDREFEAYNERLNNECEEKGIRNYTEVNGKRFYMGIFDKEKGYDEFITLGAKKYAFLQNGKLGITVSGLSKKKGAEELEKKGGLRRFQRNEVFYNSGRTIAQYNSAEVHDITVNGCTFSTASNLAIVDTTYTLGISDTMLDIIERLQGDNDYE